MLRKFAYNKIFRTTGMLLLLILLLLFPAGKKYSLKNEEKTIKTISNIKKTEIFLLDDKDYIARCEIEFTPIINKIDYAKKILELLKIGGKYENKIPSGFRTLLDSDLKINNIEIKDNYIYLDLSKDLLSIDEKYEEKLIELITYNLTNIEGIVGVYIKIDGNMLNELPKSKKIIEQPFTRKDGINKNNDFTDYKNISSTTVYYLAKHNNNYYYVPVTKITNSKKEKIQVIIDELTSAHIYETNLMSFLNYNTKLLDYKIDNDILSLNFNNYIFDSIKTNKILEEVIYSISLSIMDNYDVKEVIFNVNGEEITKSVLKNIE